MHEPWIKKIETRKDREGVFSYDLGARLKLKSRTGRPIPDELRPKLDKAFEETMQELFDKVASIFDDYEAHSLG